MIDLAGIGNLLEYLVAADNITCEERDRIILRIAKENDIAEYTLSALAGYGKSKSEVLVHKLSLMYRIILLDLLDIPLNRYKERLSNRIETINCWWADRCDQ